MQVTVQKAIIDMSMVLKPSKDLWAWEVPVVMEKFGEGRVRLLDEVEVERDSLPDAADEFARLGIQHGADGGDGGTNIPYVEMAYGRGRAGIQALKEAMAASVAGSRPKPGRKKKVAAKKPAPPPSSVVDVDERDPLAA
jgi:hypothetical protein